VTESEPRPFLDGLDAAPRDLQEVILHRAQWQRGWANPPVVVGPSDFVPLTEAKRAIRFPDVRRLQTAGAMGVAY